MIYKITEIYFILHAVFGLLLQLFSNREVVIRHLGWLSNWTMGWACYLKTEEREGCWGILWHLTVLQQQSEGGRAVGWLLTDGMQSIALQPPSSADCRRLRVHEWRHYPASPRKVNRRLHDTLRINFKITKDALDYRGQPINHVAGRMVLLFSFFA